MGKRGQKNGCCICKHPHINEINADMLEYKLTLPQIIKKYSLDITDKHLSYHGVHHVTGYDRANLGKKIMWGTLDKSKINPSKPVVQYPENRISHRSSGKIVDIFDPTETMAKFSHASREKQDCLVIEPKVAKVAETHVVTQTSSDPVMAVDDLILEHKLEITRLEHMKSLGKTVV